MSVQTRKELRLELSNKIEGTAHWREAQAERFPDDADRNREAADALNELSDYLMRLPDDANFLKTYQNFLLWASENGSDYSMEILSEVENEMLRSFGMQDQETTEDFLERWLNAIRSEFKNFDETQKN